MTSLTIDSLRSILEESGTDMGVDLDGKRMILYLDAGGVEVTSDQTRYFNSWEEMLKTPVFYGKRLEEVIDRIDLDY